MKVLSLFDGMACGAISLTQMGIPIERYVAYEYDEETANEKKGRPFGYAALVASHNFPFIEQRGNVFNGDFTEFKGFDAVVGGSPCTYWSIAQKNNRETEASGLGWKLFSQYVRAVKEAQPKFFLYENNKSMSKEIRASIDKAFGFEAVGINSALLSAQNRQRLYWVGKRNDDGTYSKVDVKQPEDRGILLKDVLDGYAVGDTHEKAYVLSANYANGSGEKIGNYAAHTLTKGCKTMVAEPVNTTADGKAQTLRATCYKDGIRNMVGNNIDRKTCVAVPVASENARLFATSVDGKWTLSNSITAKVKMPVYIVSNGLITIKDKQYPIKLADGFYIIRKLTVNECKRLQTVPEWYDFSVISNSQAYKCLGNAWTVEVIIHLLESAVKSIG